MPMDGINWTIVKDYALWITAISAAIAALWKFVRPVYQIVNRITVLEKHEKSDIESIKALIARVDKVEDSSEAGIAVICRCMLAMLNNSITGNGVDKLKTARDEMQDYLINR